MMRLSADQIEAQLKSLTGWKFGQNAISKQFAFPDFKGAIRFVNAVADVADPGGHRPDILIGSSRVTITLWSREVGGVTRQDIDLAITIEGLAAALAA